MTFTDTLQAVTGLLRRPAPKPAAPQAAPLAAAPPEPVRTVDARVEFRGLLWHPVIGVQEQARLVVSAKAGLPYCRRCDKALSLSPAAQEVWSCGACAYACPGKDVDFSALDAVVAEAVSGFLQAHPDFSPAPGLNVPLRAVQPA